MKPEEGECAFYYSQMRTLIRFTRGRVLQNGERATRG